MSRFHHCSLVVALSLHAGFAQLAPPAKLGGSIFVRGTFGSLDSAVAGAAPSITGESNNNNDPEAAAIVLASILADNTGASGQEQWKPSKQNNLVADEQGNKHLRFEQTYDGLEVVDAAMVMHINAKGDVFAVNGEYVAEGSVDTSEQVTCKQAFRGYLTKPEYASDAKWLSECSLKIVMDESGEAHKAWERIIGYWPEGRPQQKDALYASTVTGELVTARTLLRESLKLRTEDCYDSPCGWTCQCKTISTSTSTISTNDTSINGAHNGAIATYNFFAELGRDSYDDKGGRIVSHVHVGSPGYQYNYAYWDEYDNSVNYGDGDGTRFGQFPLGIDVVAHEISHGVIQYSSGLYYDGESAALAESLSDIFAACVDYKVNANATRAWSFAENVFTPSIPNDALRYMDDPAKTGGIDYYPNHLRYDVDSDNYHRNAGISSLAFYLMVKGGIHPRGKTTINVTAIDSNFDISLMAAAQIFYKANTECLTPRSGFFAARDCTLLHAGTHSASVSAAWDAVGVSLLPLYADTPISGLAVEKMDALQFRLQNVSLGTRVLCTIKGDNGDADLFTNMVTAGYLTASYCESKGDNSNEACEVGPLKQDSDVYVSIKAFESFSNLTLVCSTKSEWTDLQAGAPLSDQDFKEGTGRTYVLKDVPALTTTKCTFTATNGIPDVYGFLAGDTGNYSDYAYCGLWEGSFQDNQAVCKFDTVHDTTDLILEVNAYNSDVFGFTLLCTEAPLEIHSLVNWQLHSEKIVFADYEYQTSKYYSLDTVAKAGEEVTCVLQSQDFMSTNLFVQLGNITDLSEDPLLGCAVYAWSSSDVRDCTTAPVKQESSSFIQVDFYPWYYDKEDNGKTRIMCGVERHVDVLQNGVVRDNEYGYIGTESALRMFSLKARKGETVACQIDGNNGNANLYMRIGEKPHPLSDDNDCNAAGLTSVASCAVPRLTKNDKVYAAIHAARNYTDVTIVCTRDASTCNEGGEACKKAMDCCGSEMICDGPNIKSRVCKEAVNRGGACVRNTECHVGFVCKNEKCTRR